MDRVELIALLVGGGLIAVVILVVILRPALGGARSGYIDPGGDGGASGD